jgi:hypothetical protein
MNGKALMLIRTLIVSGSVAAIAALGTPAVAATHRAALATTTIKVVIHNSTFVLSAKTAPQGVVIFKVFAAGPKNNYRHNFSINGHTTRLLSPYQSQTLRVTFLRKGRYTYKDTVDHFAQQGQEGVFTIT